MDEGSTAGGYITDLTYAQSFFRELSPAWLRYVAALSGVAICDPTEAFNYLELGCGLGHTALINAAAHPHATFHACDLNPAHIAAARERASACAIDNIEFHQSDFRDLHRQALPSFDFIVLHGVYSWVDAQTRAVLRSILASQLRTGGVAYLSYNCLPGWSSEAPLRKLLVELAASEHGDTGQRGASALEKLLELGANKLQFFQANPAAPSALAAYQRGRLDYLAHEFMNPSWELFYGVDVADELQSVGLEYLGSATLADNHPMLLMDERTAAAIAALPSERQRRLVSDFATNQRFRRDVFVRGTVQRAPEYVSQQLARTLVGCVRRRDLTQPTLRVPRGELTLQADFVHELAAVLRHGPLSIGQVVTALHRPGRDAPGILRNLLFLIAAGTLQPCARIAAPRSALQSWRYANRTLQEIFAHGIAQGGGVVVPSPVLGNGIRLQPLETLAVAGAVAGHGDAVALTAWLQDEIQRGNYRSGAEQSIVATARAVIDELLPVLVQFEILR